jgi:hypothetical protein
MTARARGPELYARELERALSRIRERPVVLSPRDWELVLDWHAREIPLGVILESLEEAGARARKRGSAGPRSLSYLASAVEEAWHLIRSGRLDPLDGASAGRPPVAEVRGAWTRACDSAGVGTPLARLIRDLLARLEQGEAPRAIENELERSIVDRAPTALVERIRGEVDSDLAPYRSRIPPDRLDATARRALVTRLRRSLGLPRLPIPG